jgi:hypothetical protein
VGVDRGAWSKGGAPDTGKNSAVHRVELDVCRFPPLALSPDASRGDSCLELCLGLVMPPRSTSPSPLHAEGSCPFLRQKDPRLLSTVHTDLTPLHTIQRGCTVATPAELGRDSVNMIASHAPPEVWVPRFRARAIRADKAAVVCGSQQVVANAAADGVIHHLSRETHIRQSRSEQAVIGVSRFVLVWAASCTLQKFE